MPPTIKDRAVKCLHELPSFKAAPVNGLDVQLKPGETLLGVYEPTGIGPTDIKVTITNLGMHWNSMDKRHFVEYSQIRQITSHVNKDELGEQPSLRDLILELESGQTVRLPIWGQYKHYLEMFDVWRFLNYVLHDIERELAKGKTMNEFFGIKSTQLS